MTTQPPDPGPGQWACEAYGPEGREIGALCFFSHGGRVCGSLAECHRRMAAERQRVFGRIQEGAAAGDPDMVYLASQFTSPDQLLDAREPAGPEAESPSE